MRRGKKPLVRLKIKELAEARKINQSKLSRMADVNLNTIRAIWDNPYRDITLSTLEKIAIALDLPMSELYDEKQ